MDIAAPISRADSAANRAIIERLFALFAVGQEAEALAEVEALLAAEEDHPAALYGLALMSLRHQTVLPALQALQRAHLRDPSEAVYAEVLAVLYALAGNLATAAYFGKLSASLGFDVAVQLLLPPSLPTFPRSLQIIKEAPYLKRGDALATARQYTEAVGQYEVHLAFFPGHSDALRRLGYCLLKSEQPARAVANLSDLRSDGLATARDLGLLAQAYAALGELESAEACHREAVALDADDLEIDCAWLAGAVFNPTHDEAALVALAKDWGAGVSGVAADEKRSPAEPFAGRRIRVGYLASATRDPRDLEVLATVAAASDPQRFEIYLYGYRSIDEPSNALLRGCHDEWRDIANCDAATLAATIKGDGIDIVVDIGGHGAPVHLGALAQRPAPYQVSWLGNPVALGLPQIDAELTTPFGPYCYDYLGQPPARPGSRAGAITFGADLALAQLHPELVGCWARVLNQVPGSVLALRDRTFIAGGLADHLLETFGEHGVAERIDVINTDATGFYRQVDVVLAPFVAINPHDVVAALTAGVPVVALAGAGRHRRQASDLLHNLGLDQLVAVDVDGYVELAARLANTPEDQAAAITAITAALASSPVFDPSQFAEAFDAALLALIGDEDCS